MHLSLVLSSRKLNVMPSEEAVLFFASVVFEIGAGGATTTFSFFTGAGLGVSAFTAGGRGLLSGAGVAEVDAAGDAAEVEGDAAGFGPIMLTLAEYIKHVTSIAHWLLLISLARYCELDQHRSSTVENWNTISS